MTPIKYIGHRDSYRDGAYGSGIVFGKGETINVDDELARKLLRHKDVYVRGDAETVASVAVPSKASDDDDDPNQAARDVVSAMEKDGLETYAKTHFNVDLDKRKSVSALRQQVIGLIDQYGLE